MERRQRERRVERRLRGLWRIWRSWDLFGSRWEVVEVLYWKMDSCGDGVRRYQGDVVVVGWDMWRS